MITMRTEDEVKQCIAANVNFHLARLGWSRNELAKQIGRTPPVIYAICEAKSDPSSTTLDRIAEAFGLTVDRLLMPRSKEKVAAAS